MQKNLKLVWEKIKYYVAAFLAGAVAVLFFILGRRKPADDTAERALEERRLQDEADKRLKEETEKLNKAKEAALQAEEKERQRKLDQAAKKAAEEAKRLKELEEKDKEAFKREMERRLGVSEKKEKN